MNPKNNEYDTGLSAMSRTESRTKVIQNILIALLSITTIAVLAGSSYVVVSKTNFDLGMLSPAPAVGTVLSADKSASLYYKAVENHMSVKHITQTMTRNAPLPDQSTATVTITAQSDFTSPATPSTSLGYTITATDDPENGAALLNRDQIIIGKDLYARIPASAQYPGTAYTPDKWYKITPSTPPLECFMFNMFGTDESVNTPYGEIPVGNFTSKQRATIMKHIRDTQPYTIGKAKIIEVDEKPAAHYTITYDLDKLIALNEIVAKELGTKNTFTDDSYDRANLPTLELSIDYRTKRLLQINMANPQNAAETSSVTYTYPTSPAPIEAPKDAIDLGKDKIQSSRT